jgi:hypothetical protein
MRKKILQSLVIHILIVWVVLNLNFVLPYVYKVNTWGDYLWKVDGTATTVWEYFLLLDYYRPNVYYLVAKIFLFIPLVELNYWYLFRQNRLSKALINSFIIGALIVTIHQFPWNKLRFENDPLYPITSLLTYAGYAIVYGMIRKYLYEKAHRKELQLQRFENELNALKAQLNPHFFFNGLNYLYGTALNEQAKKTAEAINIMSTMMRYSITGMKENFVPLAEELKFIKSYLAFQRARLPQKESIVIETHIALDNEDQQIAPLLLLPFIENAFKYGVSIDHPCYIKIRIEVNNGRLTMTVDNRIINEHDEVKGNNTGIINTKKRLDLLYENNYSLQYGETGNEYKVTLTLKLT